jgi:hypothetical protein
MMLSQGELAADLGLQTDRTMLRRLALTAFDWGNNQLLANCDAVLRAEQTLPGLIETYFGNLPLGFTKGNSRACLRPANGPEAGGEDEDLQSLGLGTKQCEVINKDDIDGGLQWKFDMTNTQSWLCTASRSDLNALFAWD